jgi:hypothetical protein
VAEASRALLEARRQRLADGGRPATAAAAAGLSPHRQSTALHEAWRLGVRADERLGGTAWPKKEAKEGEYKPGEAARRIASGMYNQL